MRGPRRAATASALLLPALALGCMDPIGPRHETAVVELESSDGSAVRLITSNDFVRGINEDQQEVFFLQQADTIWAQVPYSQTFDLRETGQFYARAAEVENPEATVTMRVLLDGEPTFIREDNALTGPGLQFYYQTR